MGVSRSLLLLGLFSIVGLVLSVLLLGLLGMALQSGLSTAKKIFGRSVHTNKSKTLKLVGLYFDRADRNDTRTHYRSKIRFLFEVVHPSAICLRPPTWEANLVQSHDPFRSGLEIRPSHGSWVRVYYDTLLLCPGDQVRMWVGIDPVVSDSSLLSAYQKGQFGVLVIPIKGTRLDDGQEIFRLEISKQILRVDPKWMLDAS